MFISRSNQYNLVIWSSYFGFDEWVLKPNGSGYWTVFRTWANVSERNIRLSNSYFRTWTNVNVISILISARKQRCAPYDVDKVYFFAVQCRISSATKTSVNGPSRLTSEAVIKRSISYKLSVTSYKKPKYRIQIIINYKLQITNYKLQITSYKLQVTNYKLQITNYKLQITNYKL